MSPIWWMSVLLFAIFVESVLMERRQFLLVSGVGVTSIFAGCSDTSTNNESGGGGENSSGGSGGTNETNGNESDGGGETSIDSGESHSFEGSGSDVSDEFELQQGITTIEFSYSGESNFIATMVALEGEDWDDELLVNQIGSTEGRSVIATSGGAYQLDVDADGDWSINLEQPSVSESDAESPPVEESGSGTDYFGPVTLDGVHEVTASHEGERNFIIQSHGIDGDWDLVINEIGSFEGSSTVRSSEIVYFNVEADGDWTVSVE